MNWSHLRSRGSTAKLTGTSASLVRHRSSGAVASFERSREKGEGKGVRLGFIGRGCCVDGRGAGRAGETGRLPCMFDGGGRDLEREVTRG